MKLIQTNRNDLLNPLQAVSGIVEKRHTLPILSNVLIERIADQVHLLATDLEIQITTSFSNPLKNAENAQVTVSARKLQDILRALPEKTEIILEVQQNRLQLKAGKSRFNLQILPAEDLPKLGPITAQGAAEINISQKELRSLLLLVQYAMAQQDIRYYLNGMLLVIDDETLKAVATDGHRLAYATLALEKKTSVHQEIILPRKAIQEIVKLLEEAENKVGLNISPTQARFCFGTVDLITKVVDGKFPDYTRVIPENHTKELVLDREILQGALQRVAILASEKFHGVRWNLSDGLLRISCINNQQEEATEEIDVLYEGESLDMGFNVTYILDVLNNLGSDKVVCSLGDASSSMLITIPNDKHFRYVVMPMRI
jgi:DNA polymerase III subunit beta